MSNQDIARVILWTAGLALLASVLSGGLGDDVFHFMDWFHHVGR
jgi:hypothetical protein